MIQLYVLRGSIGSSRNLNNYFHGIDLSRKLDINRQGNIYITGITSYSKNFPVSVDAYQKCYSGGEFDNFIVKYSPTGSLLSSTLFGSKMDDDVTAISIDSSGRVIVSGILKNIKKRLQELDNKTYHSLSDTQSYIACFSNDLGKLLYYIPINYRNAKISSIITDSNGLVYCTGTCDAANSLKNKSINSNYFILIINQLGNIINSKVITDKTGFATTCSMILKDRLYIGGYKYFNKLGDNLPQNFPKIQSDCYLSVFDKHTLNEIDKIQISGNGNDRITSISSNFSNTIFLAGETESDDFPMTYNAELNKYQGGTSDVFIQVLDTNLKTVYYSSYYGGDGSDKLIKCHYQNGYLFLAGMTNSQNMLSKASNYMEKFNVKGIVNSQDSLYNLSSIFDNILQYTGLSNINNNCGFLYCFDVNTLRMKSLSLIPQTKDSLRIITDFAVNSQNQVVLLLSNFNNTNNLYSGFLKSFQSGFVTLNDFKYLGENTKNLSNDFLIENLERIQDSCSIKFNIAPNPASEYILIECNNLGASIYTSFSIDILDVNYNLIEHIFTTNSYTDNSVINYKINKLQAGTYFLRFEYSGKEQFQKLLIIK